MPIKFFSKRNLVRLYLSQNQLQLAIVLINKITIDYGDQHSCKNEIELVKWKSDFSKLKHDIQYIIY